MSKDRSTNEMGAKSEEAEVNSELYDLVRILHEAIFASDEGDKLRVALKAAAAGEKASPDLALQARNMLRNSMGKDHLHGDVQRLSSAVESLVETQNRLLNDNLDRLLSDLLPLGEFRDRYEKFTPEKAALVHFVPSMLLAISLRGEVAR